MQHFRAEINPVTGAREDFYWDDQTKTLVQRSRSDVTAILENNKRRSNNTIDGRKFGGGQMMHHVADIPNSMIVKFRKEHGLDIFSPEDRPKILKLLDSPDYRHLKTTTARLNSKVIGK